MNKENKCCEKCYIPETWEFFPGCANLDCFCHCECECDGKERCNLYPVCPHHPPTPAPQNIAKGGVSGNWNTPTEPEDQKKECKCIEHSNFGEDVIIVNGCPIHDEFWGNNATPELVDQKKDSWELTNFNKDEREEFIKNVRQQTIQSVIEKVEKLGSIKYPESDTLISKEELLKTLLTKE